MYDSEKPSQPEINEMLRVELMTDKFVEHPNPG